MTYASVGFVYRNPNVSIEECKNTVHNAIVPLLKELTGSTFPLSYTTHWPALERSAVGDRAQAPTTARESEGLAPIMLLGDAAQCDWDFFVISTFRDELHFQQFLAVLNQPEIAAKVRELEEQVTDGEKLKVLALGDIFEAAK